MQFGILLARRAWCSCSTCSRRAAVLQSRSSATRGGRRRMAGEWRALETRHVRALAAPTRGELARASRGEAARATPRPRRSAGASAAGRRRARARAAARARRSTLIERHRSRSARPTTPTTSSSRFVLTHLPVGVVGLVLAAIFAAAMNSTSAELNALTSTTVVDVYQRLPRGASADAPRGLGVARSRRWSGRRSPWRSPSTRAGSAR